ncbi:NAD(P)/FAD-dependent oxidoreductase [Bacillus ginsengihumi]|uniref:NAD(P)/FAD-dependent oxidoreductase n=1 Tax=Heyndrickxia ginsengihumi TaxID=363870 RepID=A0A0A6VJ23_9BACI|nr:NAD(P)/FAD-dependent oxidoreductase [Heyndrickxia ginsengihumi]KHD86624.1 pyridine nucleotide-disulfide oxidoreductase [Heyndrickxia ginsengihumi]MBE6184997.1 NAD(P)/FAD-dependent oxidoreductase [Bacillus sp. (in: firmicutes)]MCM3022663.1 NAD(P)/FAD-dependent oxidoreductase [Heyndrickxia ginsengihumi]NEY18998.1 NAD(P)/FAD-dependent oxidoreductase [Heyndrickxia ginsengihumi]
MIYDCVIIGGGIAGLQAAIQLGRYHHQVLVIDSNNGRSNLCNAYHNILGYPDGVSGQVLRNIGVEQAKALEVEFIHATATNIEKGKGDSEFSVMVKESDQIYRGRRLLFATGVMDTIPPFPEIYPCLGISIYVCPDCDGYEVSDKQTIVFGSGNVGAKMALSLTYWTDKLIYINHSKVSVDKEIVQQLKEHHIKFYEASIDRVLVDNTNFHGVLLENGQTIYGERGFLAFGNNEVRSQLANQLGVQLHQNRHILVNARTKMTNIEYVWAAGDIVAHSEQVTIAMGEGSQAAIWIHKSLMPNEKSN